MPVHLLPRSGGASGPDWDRRSFLAALLLGGAAMRRVVADDKGGGGADRDWLALVSDTHIAADPMRQNRGQTMAENLRRVVAEILAEPTRPRCVVIDGDLALADGQAGDYRAFLGLVEPLRAARVPVHLTLGNHDDRRNFREVLKAEPPPEAQISDKHVSVVDAAGLRLLLLDSLDKVNVTPGLLGEGQRAWLGKVLDDVPDRPTLVFMHHNPSHHDGALIDTQPLLEILAPRKQVKALVYGHSHRWELSERDGLHLINLPAVAYNFAEDQPLGWCRLDPTEAGARLTLRAFGGDRRKDQSVSELAWRS